MDASNENETNCYKSCACCIDFKRTKKVKPIHSRSACKGLCIQCENDPEVRDHFQALRDAQEPAEVSMAKAKRKEKEMIETFTRKLASGQMLSAHELMHFSMIDGAAMSRAMKLYEEKQQMSSQTVQRFSFRTHV